MRHGLLSPTFHDHSFTVRVAVVVTGPDMYAACDHLLRSLVPELAEHCRNLGGLLAVIDANREHRRIVAGHELDVRGLSRTYLIGLIGNHDEAAARPAPDADLQRRFPWLRRTTEPQRIATDLRLIEEIVRDPLMASHAFFYSGDNFSHPSTTPSPNHAVSNSRTTAIRERIRTNGFVLRENCFDLETLGRYVREDLTAAITRQLPPRSTETPLETERRRHRTYAASRCRAYIANEEYVRCLDNYAHQVSPGDAGGRGLVLTGDPGAGKSALLAYWSERYRREHPDVFVIEHYTGADAADGDHIPLLRRIMAEIRERYVLDDPLPADAREIERTFPLWLGHVQREELVLVLDGLDRLAEQSQSLAWLPDYLQPHLRVIVSTVGGRTLEELREREWQELHVSPLRVEERREIVRRYFRASEHSLSADQLHRFSRDAGSANPLFLRTRLQEIGRFASSAELNERIDYFLEAHDLDDLFQRILLRLESEYGRELVCDVLSLIWASRSGLSEPELASCCLEYGGAVPAVLSALEHHLISQRGCHAFFHDRMRNAVERRYIHGEERTADVLHHRLAMYFRTLPVGGRRAEEEPWQLLKAREWAALCDCIGAIPTFMALSAGEGNYRLLAYWLAIGDRFDPVDIYRRSFARYEEEWEGDLAEVLGALGRFFSDAGHYAEAEAYCNRALALQERALGDSHIEIAPMLDYLATLQYHMGRGAEATALLRRALTIRERSPQPDQINVARNLSDLGAGLYAVGEFEEAERHLSQALAIGGGQDRSALPVVAMTLNNLGALRITTGSYDAAVGYFERARRINESLFGPEHPEVASNLVNHAFALQELGNSGSAGELYRRALAINERVLGPNHPQVAIALTNLGALCRDRGDFNEAEALFSRALNIRRKAFGNDNLETLDSMKRLGYVLKCRGEYAAARALYRESMQGYERICGPAYPDVEHLRAGIEEMPCVE